MQILSQNINLIDTYLELWAVYTPLESGVWHTITLTEAAASSLVEITIFDATSTHTMGARCVGSTLERKVQTSTSLIIRCDQLKQIEIFTSDLTGCTFILSAQL